MIVLRAVCVCDLCGGDAKREDFVVQADGWGVHICWRCQYSEYAEDAVSEDAGRQGALQ